MIQEITSLRNREGAAFWKASASFLWKLFVALLLLVPLTGPAQSCDPSGNWLGSVESRVGSLRLGLHLSRDGEKLGGFLISPDQTKDSFKLDMVKWTGDTLIVKCKRLSSKYTARMSRTCDTLSGRWNQAGEIDLTMTRIDTLPVMLRPQEPKPPFPYKSEEVTFFNKKAKITLAGTLTLPPGDGPFPAVVLITGSGPQDRDEYLLGHKPFLVIADHLTRAGIAVLRYDDRGVGKSGGDFQKATSLDLADDAEAAFEYLRTRKELDPLRIGLAGHSEGGMIAPIVAARNKNTGFIILLAGPGTTGKQILLSQSELIARADSVPETEIQQATAINKKVYELIGKEKNSKKLPEDLRALLMHESEGMTAEEKEKAGLTETAISNIVMSVTSQWFREFVTFDPQPWLKKVSCPVLALNGEKDLQVPCQENLSAIENALKSGKCRNYTLKALPDLNHLFQHCTTCRINDYVRISETISPEVLDIMTRWILSSCGK